jgi:hypothetical protein
MVNKREFFAYMSEIYDEDYKDNDTYRTLKKILKVQDEEKIQEFKNITNLNKKQRLAYRHALAANGKELTPHQVDQYISMIEYALSLKESE